MALQITTEISTDAGNTSSAYIRIVNYSLSKEGTAEFKLQLFKSEEDSLKASLRPGSIGSVDPCKNQEIGESIIISLTKEVDKTTLVKKMVETQVLEEVTSMGPIDQNGNATTIVTQVPKIQIVEQEVETTIKQTVADFSSIQGVDIFTIGYKHLKSKLSELYGTENIKDC